MSHAPITCSLCGYHITQKSNSGCEACPLHKGCAMVCCPQCGHTNIEPQQAKTVQLLNKFISSITSIDKFMLNKDK